MTLEKACVDIDGSLFVTFGFRACCHRSFPFRYSKTKQACVLLGGYRLSQSVGQGGLVFVPYVVMVVQQDHAKLCMAQYQFMADVTVLCAVPV